MASLIKRSTGIYHLYWYNANKHPKQISESLKTKSKSEAQRRQADLVSKYHSGEHDPWVQKWYDRVQEQRKQSSQVLTNTLEIKLEEYIAFKSDPVRGTWSKQSQKNYRYRLELYVHLLGKDRALNSLSVDEVLKVIHKQAKSEATKASDIRRMRTFLKHATNNQLILPKYEAPDTLPSFLTDEELEQVFEEYRKWHASEHGPNRDSLRDIYIDIWKFAARTGLRRGEIVNLKCSHIRDNNILVGADFLTKSKKQRIVPLMDWAEDVANRYLDDSFRNQHRYLKESEHLFGSESYHYGAAFSNTFSKMVKKALGKRHKFHDLRHTFAVWYLTHDSDKNRDFRLVALMNLLGHGKIDTTMIYAKLLPNHYRL